MKSIELYNALKKTDVLKAQVVGKNIFSKEIKNQDFFLDYFNFLLLSAVNSDDAEVCDYMLKEAESALQSYSEACEMSKDTLDSIYDCNKWMQDAVRQISKNNQKIVFDNNARLIKEINDLYHSLQQNGKSDSVISKITELDSMIVKEAFDQKMKNEYSRLSLDISSFITQSINTEKKNKSLSALQEFKKAFDMFNEDKKYKKEEAELDFLLRTKLFKYNLSILDQEVVTYYNFVYNHIFSKVKDDFKFKMVEWAIKYKAR